MPCTRSSGPTDFDDLDFDDDVSYRESSADEEDELPESMARDRAAWIIDNQDAIEELWATFKQTGTALFGRAFFQCGNITPFAHLVYKYTMPGADSA